MPEDEPNLKELMTRLTELERANAHMSEELSALQAKRTAVGGQEPVNAQATPLKTFGKPMKGRSRRSRRGLLRKGLGIAAATFGTAALFEMDGGTVLANGTESSTTFNNNGGSSPAVTANSTSSSSKNVNAIKATSTGYTGIAGYTNQSSLGAAGVYGQGPFVGVSGQVIGANILPTVKVGVYGTAGNQNTPNVGGVGVLGSSDTYYGVSGSSKGGGSTTDSAGVAGFTSSTSYLDAGVLGKGPNGIIGLATNAIKDNIYGNAGVYGSGSNGSDLYGNGVYGVSDGGTGVSGYASAGGTGVSGVSYGTYSWGGYFYGDNTGVFVENFGGTGLYVYSDTIAGQFDGNVNVNGTLTKSGGSFKIDHPLDPANKYLSHSFVESPDMKNVYDGVVTLDANGEATVTLPTWFDTLNTDFRYQLTPIGAPSPNLHIAAEINNLSFTIAGGVAGMKVCWQVTGIRQDAWAKAHRIPVEQNKSASERGHYLHPDLYGQRSDLDIMADSYATAHQWHKSHQKSSKK